MKKYVLGIDQSTQGTKGIIFDGSGKIIARTDLAHDQIINEKGWVEHNPDQIMKKDRQTFLVPKRCVSVREPYSAERRKAASERAKAAGYRPPIPKPKAD
mgnify:CR=1 FL=1